MAADGTKSFQVYGRARVREKSVRVYVGSFASKKQAEAADEQHRVTQRAIKAGDLSAAVDHKRTLGDALDSWLKAIKDQRSHDEYESRMRLYVRPTFDSTPLVKITKPKLIDLRNSLKEREEPLGNATINTLFASLSAAYSYFIEQGWCSENPLKFIRDLEVAERPFLWLQSAGEVQKLLAACNENIRTLVAVLVGTGMRLDEALHLMWTDIDLQHRVIHVHRGRRGAPKSGRLRHVPIFDSVLTVLKEMKLAKGKNTLLWPGAKLDTFDEQLPRNKTSVFRPFKAAAEEATPTRPETHLRRPVPRVGRRHLQAVEDPRPLQRRHHAAGLRAPSPGRFRRRLQPRCVRDAREGGRRIATSGVEERHPNLFRRRAAAPKSYAPRERCSTRDASARSHVARCRLDRSGFRYWCCNCSPALARRLRSDTMEQAISLTPRCSEMRQAQQPPGNHHRVD